MIRTFAVFLLVSMLASAFSADDPAPVVEPAPATAPPPTVIVAKPVVPPPPPIELPPMPPSPSSVPGVRIWPEPRFTHWPSIVYDDEDRNCSFELPVKKSGIPGSIGWEGGKPLPFVLPSATDRISGLIDLPKQWKTHTAVVTLDGKESKLRLRLTDVQKMWPMARLVDGFPVDVDGVPVVLVDRRVDPASKRRWAYFQAKLPRPEGRPLIVGDPMEAMEETAWTGLDAECRPAVDERYPHHAALVALAKLPEPTPRTIVWCPGNQELFGGAWSSEEERVLGALCSRCEALGIGPKLVLVLPPVPIDPELGETAKERRGLLERSAAFLGWTVIDCDREAGPADEANRVAAGVFTRYPRGAAQERLRTAIRSAL